MCPQPTFSTPAPLNKSAPSNLYQSQKLLSVSVDAASPILPIQDRIHHSFQTMDVEMMLDELPTAHHSKDWTLSAKAALAAMTLAALILFYQFYRNRSRPRRTRKSPRLKRVVAPSPTLSPVKVSGPGV